MARGEGSWGSEWSAKLLEGADHDLTNWLRRYGLLLQHALTQVLIEPFVYVLA